MLDAPGVPPPNGQAAFGVSLLRDRSMLVEELGQARFDDAIRAEDVLVRLFWQPKPERKAAAPGLTRSKACHVETD